MSDDTQQPNTEPATGPEAAATAPGTEPLACVSCRSRKLKCDRTHPACARCLKVGAECVYPESRRKPAFKRRNVKELEARLAQVEVYLKEASRTTGHLIEDMPAASEVTADYQSYTHDNVEVTVDEACDGVESVQPTRISPDAAAFTGPTPDNLENPLGGGQLMGLGLNERLPSFELMEELNNCFFENAYHHIPVVHQGRYLQAFYSDPMRRPPMCLQYAIWACASQRHEKFDSYADVFYKRARRYAEDDEMRGRGEAFLTVANAQSWVLLAAYESKSMLFTRASMSVARAIRLCNMLGFHRLDGEDDLMPPTIPAPATWVEREERRRVFWGAFASDSHATIATGWPSLVQMHECATRLPASEEAFRSNREEQAPFLDDVFNGAPYAGFAGTVIICHVFKLIMPHLHRSRPSDRPDDIMDGPFWIRHRELDSQILSLFMFLPEQYRLPQHIREPTAIHTNLNLHACVICLHHAAIEMATKYNLPDSIKQASIARIRSAADEVANIIKMTSHNQAALKSPLCALALYASTTAYVYVAKYQRSTLTPIDIANIELIIQAMDVVGRAHQITRAFLQQVCLDVERHELTSIFKITNLLKYRDLFGRPSSNIPLLLRTPVSIRAGASLYSYAADQDCAGRTVPPIQAASGAKVGSDGQGSAGQANAESEAASEEGVGVQCFQPLMGVIGRNLEPPAPLLYMSNKRKRVSPSPAPDSNKDTTRTGAHPRHGVMAGYESVVRNSTETWSVSGVRFYTQGAATIPDRTNSTASSSPLNRTAGTETLSASSHTSPGMGLGNSTEENRVDLRPFIGRIPTPIWQATEETLFGQSVDFTGGGSDLWESLNNGSMYSDDGMLR